mgnify:CR=1 FL=1
MKNLEGIIGNENMGIFGKFFKKHGKSMAMAAGLTLASTSNPALANDSLSHNSLSSTQYSQQVNESHLPPGFRSNISIDPALAIVYENLRGTKNDLNNTQIFRILSGGNVGSFHLKYDSQVGIGIPSAVKCDGGYALVNAMWSIQENRYRAVRTPVDNFDYRKLNSESPSISKLIYGMEDLLRGNYSEAEPKLLTSIFINLYGESLGKRKASEYISNPDTRDSIIDEANNVISNMKFSQTEYMQCDPKSESTRLMLAQWGAWALTNSMVKEMEKTGNKSKHKFALDINIFERSFSEDNKLPKIRAKYDAEYYVSASETKNFDF